LRRHALAVAEITPVRTTAITIVGAIEAAWTTDRHAAIL